MNILQLVPKLNIGGVEKGTIEVARYLMLNGHKAVVVSDGGRFEEDLTRCGARHYKLPVGSKNPFNMIYCYFGLKDIIKKENINIVHARSRVPALIGYFAAKHTRRIFMTTAHGQYKKHLMSRVMGWGKVVIVANETMARYMKENFGLPLQRIIIVPRGVDLNRFSFIPPSDRKGKIFRVGMISRFSPIKGHLDFIKAISYVYRKMINVEALLMGDIVSAKKDYIKKIELAIRRHRMENIVKFKDSASDVAEVMKELNVLVSANREQEAFGRTIIEAEARGTAVVATRVGGVVENVIDGVTGQLCEPMNPMEMAEKILRYAKDSAFTEKVTLNARAHVEEKYSLDDMMKKMMDVYSRVIHMKSILVFKISSLGDVILCTPSIRAIRERFPGAVIKVLVDVRFREVLENCPYIDEVIVADFKNRDNHLGFLALARRLRAERFDMSIDFQNNQKSHILAFLGGIPERYGYGNGKLSFLLNRRVNPERKNVGPVEHQSYVLGLLGITNVDQTMELWPGKESEAWADKFLKDNWIMDGQELIALSLGASERWQSKNWPVAKMIKLTDILAKKRSARVVLLGSGENMKQADDFLHKTKAKPINAVGKTSISQLVSLIKRCSALVTGDSAPMHIAAAVGTPFVVLFGPTDPVRHLAPAKDKVILRKKMECSPCYKPECTKSIKCVESISLKDVYEATVEVMGKNKDVK